MTFRVDLARIRRLSTKVVAIGIAAALSAALAPSLAAAQAPPRVFATDWLAPGTRVRLAFAPPDTDRAIEGRFVGVDSGDIVVATARQRIWVPVRSVATAEALHRRPAWRGALIWGGVGALVGAGLGAGTFGQFGAPRGAARSGARAFGILGALLGSTVGRNVWREVALPASPSSSL